MAREDNPKDWGATTIVNQFIERVTLYKLLLRNHEIKTAERLPHSDKTKEPPLPLFKFLDPPVREVEGDEFVKLNSIVIWNSPESLFEKQSGASSIIQEDAWRRLFQLPVQVVSGGEILQIRLVEPFPYPDLRMVDPYIAKNRMFISIDVNTDEKTLKEAFSRLLKDQKIPRKTNEKKSIIATSKQIIKHAFIPTLGFRILKLSQDQTWSQDEEIKFVEKKLEFKTDKANCQDYGARKAAIRSVALLDNWLSSPAHIIKLKSSLE